MKLKKQPLALIIGAALITASAGMSTATASSHREAPFITEIPKVDGTDFYMFNSYEKGREDFITLIANYHPLQDSYGGPNYFSLDPEALYEIHVDSNGDANEDLTFQFKFKTKQRDFQLKIGDKDISIPLINTGPISADDTSKLHKMESYSVKVVRGHRRFGKRKSISNLADGSKRFIKPVDNIGNKSIPDYENYANSFIYDINIPGCSAGRMFVGQRNEPFSVNLGEVFDLVNTNPVGPVDGEANIIADKNITSIALEIPKDCLATNGDIIGGWTTSSLRQIRILNRSPGYKHYNKASLEGGAWTQVSRLGSPLVNELVIGIKDKDRFNSSHPSYDAHPTQGFGDYVTNPTLPALLEGIFGVTAPTLFPRADLVQAFLTGVPGLNQPDEVRPAEMLRLNTGIPSVIAANQLSLGVIGGDTAGFPNGRRPGDDVVDIALRVMMGVLLTDDVAPSRDLPYTDGADVSADMFGSVFPYLNTPIPGSPNVTSLLNTN